MMFGIHRMSPAAVAAGLVVLVVLAGGARARADQEPATTDPHASHGAQEGHDAHGAHAGHADQAAPSEPADHTDHSAHADPSAHAGHGTEAPAPAAEVPSPGQPAGTLRPDALDAPAATSVADAQRSVEMSAGMAGGGGHEGHGGHGGHGAHGVARYRHVDVGRGPEATEAADESHDHQGHGAEAHQHQHQHQTGEPAAAPLTGNYICPMHSEVASETPGTCPRCGMALVPRKGEE